VPEKRGDGILFPALIIGLGRFGLEALTWFRQRLLARFGDTELFPNVRVLGIDTDAASAEETVRASAGVLRREEILLARLGRAGRYLRPPDSLPPVSGWLPAKALFRIPREPLPQGNRALGRLAFVDNYRGIVARLCRELAPLTKEKALSQAIERTGLGLRTNRPHVYIVASLAGGTGSGMVVDLAYVVRAQLRQGGYEPPSVIGLFNLPEGPPQERALRNRGTRENESSEIQTRVEMVLGVDSLNSDCKTRSSPETVLARANAYAALVELLQFSSEADVFQAHYDTRSSPLVDSGPPFSRAVLLATSDPAAAGETLSREVLTPLGHEAEQMRSEVRGQKAEVRRQTEALLL
jgi:hypothetical protein